MSAALIRRMHSTHQAILDKAAIIERNKVVTYRELWHHIDAYSENLVRNGIREGQIIAISSANCLELCGLFLATLHIGAVPFILNYRDDSLSELHFLTTYLINTKQTTPSLRKYLPTHCKVEPFDETFSLIRACDQTSITTNLQKSDALLVTSSGSKGIPKIMRLTANGLLQNIESNIDALQIQSSDMTVLALPMGYSYGLVGQFLSYLYAGATIVLADMRFFLTELPCLLQQYPITTLFMVPPMIRQINYFHNKGLFRFQKKLSLRFVTVGGNRIEPSAIQKAMEIFGCPLVKTYGLAEAGPRVSTHFIDTPTNPLIHSVGRPNKGVRVNVLDRAGNVLKANEVGTIQIESASVTSGYVNLRRPKHIRPLQSVTTRDIGYKTQTGEIIILGRRNETIQLNKRQIWFQEIENILYERFKLLKVSIDRQPPRRIRIRAMATYDNPVNPHEIIKHLQAHFQVKMLTMFQIEMVKANEFISEK